MKDHDADRHPGPWRVMRGNPEFAGLVVAVGFLVMGFVSVPLAKGFVLGTVALGVVVALVLRFTPKKYTRAALGTVIILPALGLLWAGHKPRRPHTVSSNALYVLPNNGPFTWRRTGYWLDCWFDKGANVDRCRLAGENGSVLFEDVFLPCAGHTPIPQWLLVFKTGRMGDNWTQSPDKSINVPVVYLDDGQVLLPQSFYADAKRDAGCGPL